MEVKFTVQEKERLVEAAKWDFLIGLKRREASVCKLKLGKFPFGRLGFFHPFNMVHQVGFRFFFPNFFSYGIL